MLVYVVRAVTAEEMEDVGSFEVAEVATRCPTFVTASLERAKAEALELLGVDGLRAEDIEWSPWQAVPVGKNGGWVGPGYSRRSMQGYTADGGPEFTCTIYETELAR